jgi:hypothetical protein
LRPRAWNIAVSRVLADRGDKAAGHPMAKLDNPDWNFSASPDNARMPDTDPWEKEVPGIFDDRIVRERMIEILVKAARGGRDE